MFYLIETPEQLKQFEQEEHFDDCYIEFIQGNDKKHPQLDTCILVYIFSFKQNKGFMIGLDHPECVPHGTHEENWKAEIQKILSQYERIFVWDKKKILHSFQRFNWRKLGTPLEVNEKYHIIDLQSRYYLSEGKPFEFDETTTTAHTHFTRKFGKTNVNKMIPVGKHYELCESKRRAVYARMATMMVGEDCANWYDNTLIPVLSTLEGQGLHINDKFDDYFDIEKKFNIENDRILGQYNYQTTTGRPTNNFNGVNFSALKKENGERECFIAKNDYLVEVDYEGYHPRIIADLVGYEFSTDSVHKQLAELYFPEKEEIGEEEYQLSKTITFQQMYGGVRKEFLDYEYFIKTQEFINNLWEEFTNTGHILTPIAQKKISKHHHPNIKRQKLFNYYIQSIETENNIEVMKNLFKFLDDKHTDLVLYVYDSFLFDFSKLDGKETLVELNKIITNGKFPVKIKSSKNYNELKVL